MALRQVAFSQRIHTATRGRCGGSPVAAKGATTRIAQAYREQSSVAADLDHPTCTTSLELVEGGRWNQFSSSRQSLCRAISRCDCCADRSITLQASVGHVN